MVEQSNSFVPQMREMARHMAWADATVWSAVLAAPQAADDEKIADTLHHIHLVQHIFVQAWTGAEFALRERKEFATLADIAAWGSDGRRGVLSFVDRRDERPVGRGASNALGRVLRRPIEADRWSAYAR